MSPDGTIIQSIRRPAVYRDVAVLPNGDFVTASTDSCVRFWSRSQDRKASDEVLLSTFEEHLQLPSVSV